MSTKGNEAASRPTARGVEDAAADSGHAGEHHEGDFASDTEEGLAVFEGVSEWLI